MSRPKALATLVSASVGALLVMTTGIAAAAPAGVSFSNDVKPPSTTSFDIGWVVNSSGQYFLADHTNNAIDLFDAAHDAFSGYVGQGLFTGATAARSAGGPNGVLTDDSGRIWAGDGDSSIKVLRAQVGTGSDALIKSIATGGTKRADELSYDPRNQVVLIANDFEGFLTFINAQNLAVLSHFYYADNTIGQAATTPGWSTPGGGIEQSVWDPGRNLFYQALPADSPNTTGRIDVFTPSGRLAGSIDVPGCTNGPTGLALAENDHYLGACDNGAADIHVTSGTVKIVPGVGGADEIWYNPGDHNFYLGISDGAKGKVGVVNGDNFRQTMVINGHGGHSIAAYAGNNHVFAPEKDGAGIAVLTGGK